MPNKNDNLLSLDEANAIIKENKDTVKPIEWVAKIDSVEMPWLNYQTSCRINSEIREDILFITQYRQARILEVGTASIIIPEQYTAALLVGCHRIIGYDTNDKPHTNKKNIGFGLPYYGEKITARTHHHIWTSEGYGYAEPIEPSFPDYETMLKAFLIRANINLTGGFHHPLKNQTLSLL